MLTIVFWRISGASQIRALLFGELKRLQHYATVCNTMQHDMGDSRNPYINASGYKKICVFCGKEFTALKATTLYCSHQCASRAYKQRKRAARHDEVDIAFQTERELRFKKKASQMEYLSPSDASRYIGVDRSTIYRYIHCGYIRTVTIGALTRIPRSELDPYLSARINPIMEDMSRYATIKDLCEYTNMPYMAVYRILREFKVSSVRHVNVDYYIKDDAMKILSKEKEEAHPEITKWYTCKEIQKKFFLTEHVVYSIAYEYDIPRKTSGRTVYYSQYHINAVMKDREASENSTSPKYYTTSSAMETYGMNEGQVRNYIREYKIETKVINRTLHFLRKDFDAIFDIPKQNP